MGDMYVNKNECAPTRCDGNYWIMFCCILRNIPIKFGRRKYRIYEYLLIFYGICKAA